jgi:hypothetical protein
MILGLHGELYFDITMKREGIHVHGDTYCEWLGRSLYHEKGSNSTSEFHNQILN